MALLELGVQALQLGLGAVAVGELAPDQHGLVAGPDDPGLEVPGLPVELEGVLAGDDLARVDRALDPADELVGDLARQHVVRLGADQLVGRHGEVLGLALVLEVDPLAVHAEDEVGEGVEQRLDARLGLGQRGQAALVLERERGRRGHRLDEERVLLERAVVDERGHRLPVALDHGRQLLATSLRQLDGLAVQVGEGLGLGDPVGQAQGRVAERPRERLPQLAGRVRLPQLEDQLADALPRQAAAEQAEDERDRDAGEGDDDGPEDDVPGPRREAPRGERDRQEDDGRARGQVDREEDAPQRDGRGLPPPPEDVERGEERRDPDGDQDAVDRRDGVGRVDDQEGVLGAAGAAPVGVVEEGDEERPDGEREVGDADDRVDEPRLEVAAREGQERVDEDGDEDPAERPAERERERLVGRAQGPDEDGEPDGREQRPEAVVRSSRPGEEAAEDERPGGQELRGELEGGRLRVVAREQEGERARGQEEAEAEDPYERAPAHVAIEAQRAAQRRSARPSGRRRRRRSGPRSGRSPTRRGSR